MKIARLSKDIVRITVRQNRWFELLLMLGFGSVIGIAVFNELKAELYFACIFIILFLSYFCWISSDINLIIDKSADIFLFERVNGFGVKYKKENKLSELTSIVEELDRESGVRIGFRFGDECIYLSNVFVSGYSNTNRRYLVTRLPMFLGVKVEKTSN